jgi:ribosome-binding ATPase YchF (GTP1/OBG family)
MDQVDTTKYDSSDKEEVKKDNLDEKVPLLLIINVKKETAMQSIASAEEVKEDAKTLGDKFRPIDV